jgi:hypothetical protein
VKDLFGQVSPGIQREINQHFVESLTWLPADPKGKTGTYRLVFFPEVLDERGGDGPKDSPDEGGNGPQENRNARVLRPVRNLYESAPLSKPCS